MIPVIRLQDIRLKWVQLHTQSGYVLYGFLLYYTTDYALWTYIQYAGMIELDGLTGPESAVFAIDKPPADFVRYVRESRPDHPWLSHFAPRPAEAAAPADKSPDARPDQLFSNNTFQNLWNATIAVGNGAIAMPALFEGPAIDFGELRSVLDLFNLSVEHLPCLVWFESLDSAKHTLVDLSTLKDKDEVRRFFRQYFGSQRFKDVLEAAREANVGV